MADTIEGDAGPAVTLDSTILKGVRLTPNWKQEVSEKHDIRVEALQSGYTPSAGSSARLRRKTECQKRLEVDPVFFDPQC